MKDDLGQIAHLFLSGADAGPEKFMVRALLSEHLEDDGRLAERVARHFARQLGSAAVMLFRGGQASLRLYATSRAEHSAAADDLSAVMAGLSRHTNLLLVSLSPSSDLLSACEQVSVAACPEPDSVVLAYGLLKKLASVRPEALGITMVDCLSVAQGRAVAERLSQASKEFLGLTPRLDGVVLRNLPLRGKKLAQARTDHTALRASMACLRGT